METRSRKVGRTCGKCYVRMKPALQYVFYFLMIAYQCYDCVSDGINTYQYYKGDSLELTDRNEAVYRAFFVSLVVSVICALASCIGYVMLITGLSRSLYKHRTERNNTFKLGRLIVFISLFIQVSFEESIQSVVMYYYIVRCSVVFSFWKTSLFVCITLSLCVSAYTFLKAGYLWLRKEYLLPRKYPSCLAPCYNQEASHFSCIAVCLFGVLLTLGLFGLNIATLVDIIKYSETDVPHILVKNNLGTFEPVKIIPVKELLKSDAIVTKAIPCATRTHQGSHFLGDHGSTNCTTALFTLSFAKRTKKLTYQLHYCFNENNPCTLIKATNISLAYSHELCSPLSPFLGYLGNPNELVNTTVTTPTSLGRNKTNG